MNKISFRQWLISLSMALTLTACGGGGDSVAGIGGTGITTSGTITGFGSIFVNGIEFETNAAAITVDDNTSASQNDLALGMVVRVTGTVDSSGSAGTADDVIFDDSIEGPIAGPIDEDADGQTKTFTILGQTVVVDKNTTVFDDTSYETLAENDVLEVSGFVDATGVINATRVEKKSVFIGSAEVELKGTVSALDTGTRTFNIGTIAVSYPITTEFEDMTEAQLVNGLFVEVKGTFDDTNIPPVTAAKIEKEDEGFGDDVENISIEGLITDFLSPANFKVQGQIVDASGTNVEFKPASLVLANGVKVKVEGPIEGGVLKATKVEQRGGGDFKFETIVHVVDADNGIVTLEYEPAPLTGGAPQLVNVTVTSSTLLKDENQSNGTFTLGELLPGEFVEVRALDDGSGSIIASDMEREEADDRILQGPVETASQSPSGGKDGSITIQGVVVNTSETEGNEGDPGTDFMDENENIITPDAFFAAATAGRLVKVKDNEPGNGFADEVELEN